MRSPGARLGRTRSLSSLPSNIRLFDWSCEVMDGHESDGPDLVLPLDPWLVRLPRIDSAEFSPPCSPTAALSKTDAALPEDVTKGGKGQTEKVLINGSKRSDTEPRPPFSAVLAPRMLEGTVTLQRGDNGSFAEYGSGAWSTVFQGILRGTGSTAAAQSVSGLPSPPASPLDASRPVPKGARLVAVKTPVRNHIEDAKGVIYKEARVLTYIQPLRPAAAASSQSHVIEFLGYEATQSALVLEALPLSLMAFSQSRGRQARENFTTRTMHDPVVGVEQWLVFARGLVRGLEYLHRLKVVHGDVKSANILLRPRPSVPLDVLGSGLDLLDPVYCDFSSARVVEEGLDLEPISAVTPDYAAPELLEAFYKRPGRVATGPPVATFASDVFALGSTLLVPVLGTEVYADASVSMQRLTLALQGQPISHVRRTEQASRLMPGGLVDRIVGGAVAKDVAARWDVAAWSAVVDREADAWKQGRPN